MNYYRHSKTYRCESLYIENPIQEEKLSQEVIHKGEYRYEKICIEKIYE